MKKYLDGIDNAIENSTPERNLKVLDIQEKERQRIARDLHDTSLQNLAHIVHKIELASMYIDKDILQAKLELAAVNKNMKSVIEDIRNTIFDLRPMPFDDLGLKESFERLFYKLKESNKDYDIESNIEEITCDNNLVLMTIYRVVQEACTNAIKHSQGNKLVINIGQDERTCNIIVKDNGKGFSVDEILNNNQKHFGVSVMKERVDLLGGIITFNSNAKEGTEISIKIPV